MAHHPAAAAAEPSARAEEATLVKVPFAEDDPRRQAFDVAIVDGAATLFTQRWILHLAPDLSIATTTTSAVLPKNEHRPLTIVGTVGHRVLARFDQDQLLAFDSETGAVIWRRTIPHLLLSIWAGERLVVTEHQDHDRRDVLLGLDPADGTTRWEVPDVARIVTNGHDVVALDLADDALRAVDPRDGSIKWTERLPDAARLNSISAFAASERRVAIARYETERSGVPAAKPATIDLLDISTGRLVTETTLPSTAGAPARMQATFARDGDELYLSGETSLARVDPRTGAEMWALGDADFAAPARGETWLFVTKRAVRVGIVSSGSNGNVCALDPATGAVHASYGIGRAADLRVLSLAPGPDGPADAIREIVVALPTGDSGLTLLHEARVPVREPGADVDLFVTVHGEPARALPLLVGDQAAVTGDDGHWRGRVEGRGVVVLRSAVPRAFCGAPAQVDLDAVPVSGSAVVVRAMPLSAARGTCPCGAICDD